MVWGEVLEARGLNRWTRPYFGQKSGFHKMLGSKTFAFTVLDTTPTWEKKALSISMTLQSRCLERYKIVLLFLKAQMYVPLFSSKSYTARPTKFSLILPQQGGQYRLSTDRFGGGGNFLESKHVNVASKLVTPNKISIFVMYSWYFSQMS